jgi:hypothetical protein
MPTRPPTDDGRTTMARCGRRANGIVAVGLSLTALTAIGCVGDGNFGGKGQEGQAVEPVHAVRLSQVYPYYAKGHCLTTHIVDRDSKRVDRFAVLDFDAKDQNGRACPFESTWVGWIKGGVGASVSCRIDPEVAEKVFVKARIRINKSLITVACGYRKRTAAERSAMNSDQEWTYLDGSQDVQVSSER